MTAKTGAQVTRASEEPMSWQCLTCEYVVVSAILPFRCPRCGASRVKFIEFKPGAAAPPAEE